MKLNLEFEKDWLPEEERKRFHSNPIMDIKDLPKAVLDVLVDWEQLKKLREIINKEMQPYRDNKTIGSSLDAHLILKVPAEYYLSCYIVDEELRFVFGVSKVTFELGSELNIEVRSLKS